MRIACTFRSFMCVELKFETPTARVRPTATVQYMHRAENQMVLYMP